MDRLKGKNCVVTGATSGIGRATAIMFAAEGANVVATGRNQQRGDEVIKQITDAGGTAYFVSADLSTKEGCAKLHDFAVEKLATIDVLVNAAGMLVPKKPFVEQTDEEFDKEISTDLRSVIWTMQNFIPDMEKNGKGSVVNVSSLSAVWPEPDAEFYGLSKAAINNLTMNLALEYARKHIRFNVVMPGPVMTALTPKEIQDSPELQKAMADQVSVLGRLGQPEDIAYACVYFASDESEWVTNAALNVDGGVTVSVSRPD